MEAYVVAYVCRRGTGKGLQIASRNLMNWVCAVWPKRGPGSLKGERPSLTPTSILFGGIEVVKRVPISSVVTAAKHNTRAWVARGSASRAHTRKSRAKLVLPIIIILEILYLNTALYIALMITYNAYDTWPRGAI